MADPKNEEKQEVKEETEPKVDKDIKMNEV